MSTKRLRETTLNELVETHNIALSIRRLRGAPYDDGRWRRALYHALCMEIVGWEERKLIREALKLP